MSMFHFRVQDGSVGPDPEPMELPSYKAARGQIVTMVGDMLSDADGAFWTKGYWQMDVTDERGLILCSLQVNGVEAPAVMG